MLAPEGVPAASVDYKAFLAPALFWIGSAFASARDGVLIGKAPGVTPALIRPLSGRPFAPVATALSRQRAG